MIFHDLFFNPRGVVILGASSDTSKLGYAVARNLVQGGYPGEVHFVNPKGGILFDRPVYTSVLDVPDPIDLAVVIVPASAAPSALKDIGSRGIRAAILTSGGFREIGEAGALLEAEVLAICKEHGIRLIGPNCIGLVDSHLPMDTTFLPPPPPEAGNIAFISHSGAFCAAIIDWSRQQGFGFSRLVSLGNQADLTETDLLPYIAKDPHTKAITLYIESIPDGIRFLETSRQITPIVPIVAMKVGRTLHGQKAAASHTGALAGAEAAVDAAFEKAGIIRAYTSEQLFDWAKALANLPLPAGRNVAILTNAGGPGVIAADALADNNFALSRLDPFTIAALQQRLPPAASAQNPVDMLASATADDYAACLNALLADVQTHAVMVIIPPSPISPTVKIAQALIPIIKASDKPVLPIVMGSMLIHETLLEFSRSDIPCYSFPEKAASSLACLADRADFLMNMHEVTLPPPGFDAQAITGTLSGIQPGTDDPIAGFRVMESIGIPTAPVRLATSRAEAGVISQQLGFPLVAKIASPDISHKSDAGGVLMNLMSTADALDAFDALLSRAGEKMPSARLDGVTLQKQILNGQEVILGFARDPQFGHLVMFGSGGIDVEGLKDITFNLAPLTQREAEKMISRTWAGRKLSGFRNLPPVDRHATVEALVKLSWLAYRFPEITECEINPLKVLQQGVIAVDVRIKLQD